MADTVNSLIQTTIMQTSILQIPMAGLADSFAGILLLAETLPKPSNFPLLSQAATSIWNTSMLLPIILGAIGYLLIQRGVQSQYSFLGGVISCVLAVGLSLTFVEPTFESYLTIAFCSVATGGGVSFLVAKEPVYAALGFATAVLSTCGILFMQSALFIAAATMIVYAGATIIIFLFVLMFAQQTDLRSYDVQLTKPWLAATISAILLATITFCVTGEKGISFVREDLTRPLSNAQLPKKMRVGAAETMVQYTPFKERAVPRLTSGLGRALYTDYLIAVELAGTVLLVATIGAIALAQRTSENQS